VLDRLPQQPDVLVWYRRSRLSVWNRSSMQPKNLGELIWLLSALLSNRTAIEYSNFKLLNLKALWSWRRELNPRPSDYKSDALPTELRQL
jgi:hypothetical protein